MELSAYEIVIIGGGFTVVGALLGALITYRFALILSRVEAKRNCGRRLIEAFSPELATLNPNLNIYPGFIKKILFDSFQKHRTAMIEYGFYLTGKEKIEYEQKCNRYFANLSTESIFNKYQNENGSKMFHEDIHLILKHVET